MGYDAIIQVIINYAVTLFIVMIVAISIIVVVYSNHDRMLNAEIEYWRTHKVENGKVVSYNPEYDWSDLD